MSHFPYISQVIFNNQVKRNIMEASKEKNKINDIAFYGLMIILGSSVLYILAYLFYEMLFA